MTPVEGPEDQPQTQRRESLSRALTDRPWTVYDSYHIAEAQDGAEVISVGQGYYQTYFPMAYPRLPFELTRVEPFDRESALTFVHKWGLLGYDQLTSELEIPHYGDPVDLIWRHAYTISNVIALYDALYTGDTTAMAAAWEKLVRPDFFPEYEDDISERYHEEPWYACQEGVVLFQPFIDKDVMTQWQSQELKDEAAARAVTEIIESNIQGVRPILRVEPTEARPEGAAAPPVSRLSGSYTFRALIEGIWWHLSDYVTRQHEIARCKECDTYFQRTRKAQEFCPAPEEHVREVKSGVRTRAVSLCAQRYRTRKSRSNKLRR